MAVRQLKYRRWICYFRKEAKFKRIYFGRGADGCKAAKIYNENLGLQKRRAKKTAAGITFFEPAESYAQNKNFNANASKMLHYRLMANILPALGNLNAMRITDKDLDSYIRNRREKKTKLKRPTKFSTIRIDSAAKGGPIVRLVPIHKELYKLISVWYVADKKRGPIIHFRGRPIRPIQTSWERAKIKRRIRPYDLRHHFITKALEAGADMKTLSEAVGSSPETLMKHYQHVTRKLHRQTMDRIPGLGIQNIPKYDRKGSDGKKTAKY